MSNHERPSKVYRVLQDHEATRGSQRYGFIETSYDHLVDLFGEPLEGDGRKVDVQWIVETNAGIGTVYNFNISQRAIPVENITDWHVGGKDVETYQALVEIINS